jgi:hypothetical protein
MSSCCAGTLTLHIPVVILAAVEQSGKAASGEIPRFSATRKYRIDTTKKTATEVLGLNPRGEKILNYVYPALFGCGMAWNAEPIHLEKMAFE